ncbi:carnitine O-palmitoyltransferase 1, liver isoform-like isoform X2 [Mizuhopecten yessoensis]|uniref:carnitine O-palmitoyltransferase 1, liver isoform-like isoform X2 n=1 Tax=Mizuhopecten yessoensis TaxID=6573 RepID=UPI000B45E0D0|nr:carnitine O-palmitoyltransferase 1, liver isoform-like isoform X2 [Mizuhopecten yessoensis]
MPGPAIAPFLGATGRLMSYRNFSEASAVGFLSAILFAVFSDPVRNFVDFGEKWMELSALPYQMNIALLGFIVGYGLVKVLMLARIMVLKMLLNYHGWMHSPKSTATKLWGLMLKAIVGKGNFPLYFFQPMLPHLPVPDLNITCEKYLTSMRPLLSDEDFMNLLTAVLSFKEKEGPTLQKHLLQKFATEENWLSHYWLNLAYLTYREPCAVNVNCYATDRKEACSTNQAARASNLTHWILRFHETILEDTLKPQFLQDMIPICMDGYRMQFCTSRIPGKHVDELVTFKDSKHIVIMRKGCYYKLSVYAPDNDGKDRLLTPAEILPIIEHILKDAEESTDNSNAAVFTALKRDKWADIRTRMMESKLNKKSIEDVESAIFLVYLDEELPTTIEENGKYIMVGSGFNRWYDKSVSFVTFANGVTGCNGEHSTCDATLPGRMWEYYLQNEKYTKDGKIIAERSRKKKIPSAERLTWDMTGFEEDLEEAYDHYRKLAGGFCLRVVTPEYGKGYIKKKRMSPDGYIQMALQLAYYKLYNQVPKTYESASTRMFLAGRTETIRPVSEYSKQWVSSMMNERATREQRIMLLKRAVQYQTQVKVDASIGQGFDRHLIGLFAASQELKIPTPALFQDKSFWMQDKLSTSQTPTRYTDQWTLETCCMGGGFSPSSQDGYGISYMIYGEDLINFHVTNCKYCQTTSADKMADAILEAMSDMKELLK